jgi:glycosyltransferase involved in cell wall biosynthesis
VPLTILNVAFPLVPVSADTVGGAEQIVAALDREIEKAGHESLVLAAAGSVTRGRLIPSPAWDGQIDEAVRRQAAREHALLISETLRRFDVDVVHLHGLDFLEYLPREDVPCVATLHLPPEWYPPEVFEITRPNTVLTCVSKDQRRRCPCSLPPIFTISHGIISHDIDVEAFSGHARRNYALILGRICPEKGFHYAIEAAEISRVSLVIGGKVYPYADHQNYFERRIAPRLSDRIRFIGPIGLRDKLRLLSGARCVLIPSTVAETSSLVAMEALSSGTPVIAFRSGALPEIVDTGRTGFLVNNAGEMAEAIHSADNIDPDHCRRAARLRFSVDRMTGDYLRLYRSVLCTFESSSQVSVLSRERELAL